MYPCYMMVGSSRKVKCGQYIGVNVHFSPHPSREERAVLELAQVEGDEESSGHENQRQQRSVRLSSDRHRHRRRAVAQNQRDILR